MSHTTGPTAISVTLRQPHHSPSPRAIALWAWRAAIGWSSLAIPQLAALIFYTTTWQIIGLSVTIAIALAHVLVMPRLRYRIHRWELTSEALYTREGWVTIHWQIAPVSRVQTVDTQQGPLERRLRLTTVIVTTASASGSMHIEGLDHEVAKQLAAELTDITHAIPSDAT